MKYKDSLGNWVDINIRALDSLPVGTELDYDGTDIPVGWEEIKDVIYADDVKCKNMFNKNNYNSLGGFINSSTSKITGNANTISVYIPIEANTTYTVSKTKGNRFAIATTSATPVFDISLSNVVEDNTATSLTLTSSSSAKYLVAYVYNSGADTDTLDSILATLQIEKGSTATYYTPYKSFDTTWKYLGQTTGNASINFPVEYSEIYAEAMLNNDVLRCFSFTLISSRLTSSAKYYNEGFYVNNSLFGFARILATNTAGSLNSGQLSGTDVTSSSVTTWYYR